MQFGAFLVFCDTVRMRVDETMTEKNKQMSEDQYKELVVYVAQQCSEYEDFGVTKLNKVLFFADFFHYLKYGEPLTGWTYVHDTFGPVPKNIEAIRKKMEKKDIAIAHVQTGEFVRQRVVALREPNISSIPSEKIATLTQVIGWSCGDGSPSARLLSSFSHDFIGWDVTEMGEEIPYQTIFLENKPKQILTEADIQHGRKIAATEFYAAGATA